MCADSDTHKAFYQKLFRSGRTPAAWTWAWAPTTCSRRAPTSSAAPASNLPPRMLARRGCYIRVADLDAGDDGGAGGQDPQRPE
ncbi:MAG: hypothetical protein R3F43_32305 [bacterium]